MKRITFFHIKLVILPILLFCLVLPLPQANAQDNGYTEPSEKFSSEELAQMLAPIALYPDALLSQILMASTYPIEVIEADRWMRENPGLKGENLDTALLEKDWDPSVKAMCHFPDILALMSERISETTTLGNAFLAQEVEVMDMVQKLRANAYAQGNLSTTEQQKVVVEKETIIIEPADPRIIYVPYYDPFYIYGPWWYPAYPPYYWGPPGVTIGVGFSYWPGYHFDFAFGNWSYFDWPRHYIFINARTRPRFVRHHHWRAKPGRWDHIPRHRRGVAYRDKSTARRFGQHPVRSRRFSRDIRGFPDRRKIEEERRRENRTNIINPTGQANTPVTPGLQKQRVEGRRSRDRESVTRDRRDRRTVDRREQMREKTRLDRQKRERIEQDLQNRQRIEQSSRTREGVARERQRRESAESRKLIRKPVERNRQMRQRVEQEQQQRNSDNVFNQVDKGRMERWSSERGRSSRQRWHRGRRND